VSRGHLEYQGLLFPGEVLGDCGEVTIRGAYGITFDRCSSPSFGEVSADAAGLPLGRPAAVGIGATFGWLGIGRERSVTLTAV
jgi:hypothetical protein